MRDIKFRGKSKLTGEWVYGYYFKDFNGKSYIINTLQEIQNAGTSNVWIDVVEETVGQCTELKGKKRKEIYEGDIVKVFLWGDYTEGYVKYNNNKGRFDVGWKTEIDNYKNNKLVGSFSTLQNDYDLLEVIGNIYDNPELLEEGE